MVPLEIADIYIIPVRQQGLVRLREALELSPNMLKYGIAKRCGELELDLESAARQEP